MKHKWKTIIILTAVSVVTVVLFEIYMVVSSFKKAYNPNFMESASPEDRLKALHYVIKYPVGDPHDAFILLIDYGTEESLYYLEKRAKSYRKENNTVCTADHCYSAIKAIKKRIEETSTLNK